MTSHWGASRRALAMGLAVGLAAEPALAHGDLALGGGFRAGLIHPLLAWEHTLALLGLGLWLGAGAGRRALAGLALGLAAGVATGIAAGDVPGATIASAAWVSLAASAASVLLAAWAAWVLLAASAVIGGILASGLSVPGALRILAAAAVGAAVGVDTQVPGGDFAARAAPVVGLAVGVFLIVLNAMALARWLAMPPRVLALRVMGSWLASIAILALALALRVGAA